jgi:hypothetical protein
MIPGSVSKLSESTVASADTVTAKADILYVTGAVQVNTIRPGLGVAQSQFLILVATDGAVVLGTTGNILVGMSASQNRAVFMVWSKKLQKWILGL